MGVGSKKKKVGMSNISSDNVQSMVYSSIDAENKEYTKLEGKMI